MRCLCSLIASCCFNSVCQRFFCNFEAVNRALGFQTFLLSKQTSWKCESEKHITFVVVTVGLWKLKGRGQNCGFKSEGLLIVKIYRHGLWDCGSSKLYQSVCLCLFVCLSVCLSVCVCVYRSVPLLRIIFPLLWIGFWWNLWKCLNLGPIDCIEI